MYFFAIQVYYPSTTTFGDPHNAGDLVPVMTFTRVALDDFITVFALVAP
jgi:hypothetical protein